MQMKVLFSRLLAAALLCGIAGCSSGCGGDQPDTQKTGDTTTTVAPPDTTPVYVADIVSAHPHDTSAFTQGLLFHDGVLYESTGLEGSSSLRKVEIESGRVLQKTDVAPQYFAEGLALLGDRLYQLTWRSGIGFVYDLKTFAPVDSFSYYNEGWGITTDGTQLYMSDGTNFLRVLDPKTLQVTKTIGVYLGSNPVERLNELEWVNGEIFANIWTTDRIARIDPATGQVKGWINLASLLPAPERGPNADVLNGIAYDPKGDRLFVTGKKWPKLFEIKLRRQNQAPATAPALR